MHACMHTYIHKYIHMYMCIYIYRDTHVHVYIYIYIHIRYMDYMFYIEPDVAVRAGVPVDEGP